MSVPLHRTYCRLYGKLWNRNQDFFRENLLNSKLEIIFLNEIEEIN